MTPDYVIWGSCFLAEAALVVVLVRSRVFKGFPFFFSFICWSFLSDALFFILQSLPATNYFKLYEFQMVIDAAMLFAVMVELSWAVLRPIRSSLPKNAWVAIALLIALVGLLLWPIAGLAFPVNKLRPDGLIYFRLQQTFAILRVVFFLAMVGFSQLLAISWRNRELQVATGLGIYSVVYLADTVIHTHQSATTQQYHWLDQVTTSSYLVALAYWVYSFLTKEAERRAFTPQMQSFLLAVAGNARTARVSRGDSASSDRHDSGKR